MNAGSRARLLEVVSVLVIMTSLVALGVPMSADYRRREAAKRMLADVELVRGAVYRFYSDSAAFPPEAADGQFSDELAFYLPPTFNRTRPYGTIEYRNWPLRPPTDSTQLPDTSATAKPVPPASNVIALAIVPRDPRVAAAASALAYEMPQFTMGGRFFFVLFGS